jgi:hypothetical protein
MKALLIENGNGQYPEKESDRNDYSVFREEVLTLNNVLFSLLVLMTKAIIEE